MAAEEQQATQAVDDAPEAAKDAGDQSDGLMSELKDTAVEAALEILKPAVKSAAGSAAGYAVNKGPELVKDKLGSMGDGGGAEELAKKALSSAGPVGKVASKLGAGGKIADSLGLGSDDDDDGEGEGAEADATGSGRRMPVQQAIDVAVPLETAYNQWTQFEEYPDFMHRVDSASQEDETHVKFTEKMWGFSRDFNAEIIEQRPNERIVWRSEDGLKNAGVVTFHELAERLTRIEMTVDFMPQGFFEKLARGTRFSKRAIRADMHRFKAYIEMQEEEDGAWRGAIEDGEVVEQQEGEEEEGAQAEGEDQETEAEGSDEEEAEGTDDEEESRGARRRGRGLRGGRGRGGVRRRGGRGLEPRGEEDEEDEEEEAPAPARTKSKKQSGSSRKQAGSNGRRTQRRASGGRRPSASGRRRSPQRPKSPRRTRASS